MELGLRLHEEVTTYKYPLLLMAMCGPHAEGFGNAATPLELRGCHVVPLDEVLGLSEDDGDVRHFDCDPAPGIDVLTHDVRRLVVSYLHGGWQALELISAAEPIHTTPQADELRQMVAGRIWRHHVAGYRAAAASQWLLFDKSRPRRVETLASTYRLLLTGIHAADTGHVEVRLPELARHLEHDGLANLVERSQAGEAERLVDDVEFEKHRRHVEALLEALESAGERLDAMDKGLRHELSDFVVRTRLHSSLAGWSLRARGDL